MGLSFDTVCALLRRRALLLMLCAGLICATHPACERQGDPAPGKRADVEAPANVVPQKALDVFRYVIKHEKPPKGYVGGRLWQNRERRLPEGGDYREYDVNAKIEGVNRGGERIIVDRTTGKGWYTADHYRTFIPINSR